MKTELIKSILITDGKLCEEEIEAKLEEGDLTALPNSILQVRSGELLVTMISLGDLGLC